ncbi:phosphotransferase [Thaumasiovibrio subtropicus]|uniref:phosphotransferase n=1 Tax=Thaumasiovibrio subtropicus TaxID=1891207 RepID=UPI000B35B5D9|nr:phosphotransferase [Thaumasiovibrio subtropicus]
MKMPVNILDNFVRHFDASCVSKVESIQTLWSGYGELVRVYLEGGQVPSVIVKYISLPRDQRESSEHPRGWKTSRSHQRKCDSYQVEVNWYQHYANQCAAKVPECLLVEQTGNDIVLVLEDLTVAGYSETHQQVEAPSVLACLEWLAHFHAQYMGKGHECEKHGLWPMGTYWHLATRPDELAALADHRLKNAAKPLDALLRQCEYQTLVHGDAKLANFCFTPDGSKAAAVDFQYVGGGCGMKDVCLFLSSVLNFEQSVESNKQLVARYLAHYFSTLRTALSQCHSDIDGDEVERHWRPLFCVAWADFQRFVKGWSPEHWKINAYTETLTDHAMTWLRDRDEIK